MNELVKQKENKKNKKPKVSNSLKFTILAVILIAIFCVALTPVTLQNDTFYTIKVGEHIAQNGIDMKDPFSWHEDLPYTYPHWLYDLLTYYIYSFAGMTGIYITTCILSVILGLSIYFTNTKLAKNQFFSFVVTIGAMYLIRGYIAARAQLVTFILFVLTVYFIEQFLATKKKRYVAGLIIIPILIANMHAAVFPFYFVLYLPYIAEYLVAVLSDMVIYRKIKIADLKSQIRSLNKRKQKLQKEPNKQQKLEKVEGKLTKLNAQLSEIEAKNDKIKIKRTKALQEPYKVKIVKNNNVKWLILIMIVCIFTGLLTPIKDTPYTYLIKTMEGPTTQNINEHQPMTLADDVDVICTLILFLAILIFTKAKIRLSDLFMIAGLCYLMLASRRQVSMFGIIGALILNRLAMEIERIYSDDTAKEAVNKLTTKIGMLVITVIMLSLSWYFAKDKLDDKYISESSYPVKACDYIVENIDLSKARFYNEYNYGSYMLFRGIPVFIDSRADLYAPEFGGEDDNIFMDFIETSNISKFYEDVFKKYDITHVITYTNSKMNMIFTKTKDKNYKQLYKDDRFVVYQRLNASDADEQVAK